MASIFSGIIRDRYSNCAMDISVWPLGHSKIHSPDHVRQYGYKDARPGCPQQEYGISCRHDYAERCGAIGLSDYKIIDALRLFDYDSPDGGADQQSHGSNDCESGRQEEQQCVF